MIRNIAIFGAMYSGKSTIAAALTELGYVKVSFADPLKNVASLAYGPIDKSKFYPVSTYSDSSLEVSGREMLQRIGEAVKTVDRDFWVKCFLRDSKRYLDQPIVLDDGRFVFELEALKAEGFYTVCVDTPQEVRLARAKMILGRYPTAEELNHASEVEIPFITHKADLVVNGNEETYAQAGRIIEATRSTY